MDVYDENPATLGAANEHTEDAVESKHVATDDGDGQIQWSMNQVIAIVSLSALWTGSQIPLYFTGGALSYIVTDVGGAKASVWLPVSNTLVLASICPIVGYLQDLFGRRYITLGGSVAIMVGIVLVGTAHGFAQAVGGMCLAGAGAAVGELTALAGTSELVPVRLRGFYIGVIVLFLCPFTPYVLYCQLLSTRTAIGWRWCYWICLIYNGLAFIGILFFYFPERVHQALPGPKMGIVKKIDFVGAFLSIAGAVLFLVAIQAGGYTYPWTDARVLAPLILGLSCIIVFIIWSWKIAKRPLIPREIFRGQHAVGVSFLAAFVGGMNFYSLINFFPLTFESVFTPAPVIVGLRGLGYGISVTAGAVFFNWMLSLFPRHHRAVLATSAIIMTAFGGALAAVTPETPSLAVVLGTICGFGVGGLLVPTQTVAIICSPDAFIASTTALSLAIRVIGGSIGYAIYYNIFANKLTSALPAQVGKHALAAGLPLKSATAFVGTFLTTPADVSKIPGVTPAVIEAASKGAQWAYADGLRLVWFTSIPFGVCAIIACLFLGDTSRYQSSRIAAFIRH